jgi:hemolysin activation/secretion protein
LRKGDPDIRRKGTRTLAATLASGAAGLALLAPQCAAAQVTPPALPSQSEISRARVTLPPPPQDSNFDFRIQAPEKSAVPKAIDAVEFQVSRIVVEGATAFPQARIDALFAPLTGHPIGLEAVRQAAATLERMYREKGYFLSRVFVPPQQIENGTLKVRVLEGYIEEIFVEGMDETTRQAVRAMLAPLLKRTPIDLASVERRLLILNDLPGLSGTSVLRQGSQLGGSTLVVTLVPPRNLYALGVSNMNSRMLGPWSYNLNADLVRPLGLPGVLNLGAGASGPHLDATRTLTARYSVPVGTDGLIASVGVLAARAKPGASLSALDIVNELVSVSARGRYPLLRGRSASLFLEGGLAFTQSKTRILGQQIVNDRTSVGDLGLIFQQSGWLMGSTTVSVSAYHGLPILGAMDRSAPEPSVSDFDPNFVRFVYGVQRVQPLAAGFSTLVSIQGQYTESKLLSGELIAFGGPAIGRGYDPSAITGDRGIGGVAELRYDRAVGAPWLNSAQFYTFVDAAQTVSLATATIAKQVERIRSAGLGVRLYHRYGLIDVQAAQAHRRTGGADARPNPRILVSASLLF